MRWQRETLGDLAIETQYGTSVKANEDGRGVPVLRMNNITYEGAIDLTSIKHVELPEVDLDQYSVRRGDLLFNRTNSPDLVGKMGVWDRDERYAFAGYLIRVRLNRETADPRFVAAWFNTPEMKKVLRSRAKPSINMSNINATEVLKFPVVCPPLKDQRRIADILDRADALRSKRRAGLAELETLAQAVFVEMFGDPGVNPRRWPMKRLGELASKFSDGPFGSNLKSEHYVESGIRVIRLQNIGVGEFVDDDAAYISERHFESLRKHECRPGDVLVGTLGDPNLRACVHPTWLLVALNKADCVQVRPDESLANGAWLCALLNQPGTLRLAQELLHGQTRVRISMGNLRQLSVPVPPLPLQQEFARRVAAIDTMKASYRASLAEMDALFAALQHRAFRGEL